MDGLGWTLTDGERDGIEGSREGGTSGVFDTNDTVGTLVAVEGAAGVLDSGLADGTILGIDTGR